MKKQTKNTLHGWLFSTRSLKARAGETVRLKGIKLITGTKPSVLVALQPMILDSIVDEIENGNLPGVLGWIQREKATCLDDGATAEVLSFTRSPGRKLSCALVRVADGPFAGREVWTLLNDSGAPIRRYSDALLVRLAQARQPEKFKRRIHE